MTKTEFREAGEVISQKAQVMDTLHGYFLSSMNRLHRSCELFQLFSGKLGDVLEIGPFYGYVPFILRKQATSYTVLEGDDPAVVPLKAVYEEANIEFELSDFFDLFGPTHTAPHAIPGTKMYDTILCWETMEHFNFNPVKFTRELFRILKPGGKVCITVPNRASAQALAALVSGRGQEKLVESYFMFEDYISAGKKAFYGFHWREYTPRELKALFSKVGFEVQACGTFTEFQHNTSIGIARKFARFVVKILGALLPSHGTNVYLTATKPKNT